MTGLLECLSSYSLLQSPTRITSLVETAKKRGYEAIALTDVNVLYGAVEFDKACRKVGMKAIYGLLLEYQSTWENQVFQLLLIARDQQGYEALLKISTKRMQTEEAIALSEYQLLFQHLTIISPSKKSELEQAIAVKNYDYAKQLIAVWKQLFNDCPFYVSLPMQQDAEVRRSLLMFTEMMQLPLIANTRVSYLNAEDAVDAEVLRAIAEDRRFNTDAKAGTDFLPTAADFTSHYRKQFPQALHNLEKVVQEANVTITYHQELLPHYPTPQQQSAKDYLLTLCRQGQQRVAQWTKEYEQRLIHELKTIHEMGFDDYFLVVWDVMRAARERQILTAPGRGSAAGSLVAYLLYITDIDPLKYGLLFERFLNPHRQTMPDIDLDFPDNHRDELYQYVAEKYGHDYVARIITFGTLAAKQVVRDVTRVFGLSLPEQSEWARAVYIKQHDVKVTLDQAYEDSYALRRLVNESERNQTIYQIAHRLEGLPRNTGIHAAGVVISTERLDQFTPLQNTDEDLEVTQWPMGAVEEIGLLKMDFLSLRNLKIVDDTLRGIAFQTGETVDIKQIPLDDEKVYEAFSQAETTGIFQFESRGMRQLLLSVKPKNIEDLALVNAIHRPGPNLDPNEVMKRREGKVAITYLDESLRPILAPTYGIMVYQEQVMQAAQAFADYTLAEADILRRAMSKKKAEVLEKERQPFIQRALENGKRRDVAEQLFNQIASFAGYGFNKSHAIAYSILAYQMMYLKVNYPQAFYMALLRSVATRSQNFTDYVRGMAKQGIHLLPPDINQSFNDYTLTADGQIRMGLSLIKGIDFKAVHEILAVRKEGGPFKDFSDFLQRIPDKLKKERLLSAFIEAGVFDSIEPNRRSLVVGLEGRLKNAEFIHGNALLDDVFQLKKETVDDYSDFEKLALEKERLGAYVSSHPLATYHKEAQQLKVQSLEEQLGQKHIRAFVFVTHISEFKTKKNEPMAKVDVEGEWQGTLTATFFPEAWRTYHNQLEVNQVYLIQGTYQNNQYGQQILVNDLRSADELKCDLAGQKAYLLVPENKNLKYRLSQLLLQTMGQTPVVIVNENTREKRLLDERYWIDLQSPQLAAIQSLLGENKLAIQ